MARILVASLLLATLTACGGGGGGGASGSTPAPEPPPTDPGNDPTPLAIVDSMPAATAAHIDPSHTTSGFTHYGHSDLSMDLSANCANFSATTIRRNLLDRASTDFDQLITHNVRCALEENASYVITANGQRSNEAAFIAEHAFSTGVADARGLTVLNELDRPRSTVNDMFVGYVGGALLDDLDLPSGVESLVLGAIIQIADANWSNLVDPDALYDVRSQRVSYLSRAPDGSPSSELTAAITFPVIATATGFVPENRVIVLTHATGSTPGDLDPADAWYILANLFASRGYLVIAPDNYGRGDTGDHPETYLMATRTALNTLDLVKQVIDDPAYDGIYADGDLTIIGYSQGGHSAIGLWLALETQGPSDLQVREVYAGGAPHNLYQTFRGVMQHLDGNCNDSDWCRYVDEETTVPFATDRILPGFLSYTDAGVSLSDVVSDDVINPAFVSNFLANDPSLDPFKALLQLSSFTQIASASDNLGQSDALIHLYHSEFDRLVPLANTQELATLLGPVVTVDFHENRCNSTGYELIFNSTSKVGVLHTLCGLSVLDEALGDLK